ncbi:hypothetical protein BaRGS_00029054, partial [Batillaria attramentaria]
FKLDIVQSVTPRSYGTFILQLEQPESEQPRAYGKWAFIHSKPREAHSEEIVASFQQKKKQKHTRGRKCSHTMKFTERENA